MGKQRMISAIFKILLLYEDMNKDSSEITEEDYKKYINRTYIRFLGQQEEEISSCLRGLYFLGSEATHAEVKTMVFHLINLIGKE